MTESRRALMPDDLRLVALFGIVVVNVHYIAFSSLHGFADPGSATPVDAVTLWLVNGLATLKTYGLLSTLFAGYGPGLWGAVDRATATGIAPAVTLALIGLGAVWRMRFALGGFEWVLRRITHPGQARV